MGFFVVKTTLNQRFLGNGAWYAKEITHKG